MRAKLMVALLLVAGTASAQEVRKAIPVEREVRKAIPLEPTRDAAVPMNHNYFYNELLPYDAIRLADYEVIEEGDFYHEAPKRKPVNVPASFVLVSVFQREAENVIRFVGWVYMDADQVNELHGQGAVVSL